MGSTGLPGHRHRPLSPRAVTALFQGSLAAGDDYRLEPDVERIGNNSIDYRWRLSGPGGCCVEGSHTVVRLHADGTPAPVPGEPWLVCHARRRGSVSGRPPDRTRSATTGLRRKEDPRLACVGRKTIMRSDVLAAAARRRPVAGRPHDASGLYLAPVLLAVDAGIEVLGRTAPARTMTIAATTQGRLVPIGSANSSPRLTLAAAIRLTSQKRAHFTEKSVPSVRPVRAPSGSRLRKIMKAVLGGYRTGLQGGGRGARRRPGSSRRSTLAARPEAGYSAVSAMTRGILERGALERGAP